MEGIHPPIQGNVPLKNLKYGMQSYLVQNLAFPSKNLNITFLFEENISYWIREMQLINLPYLVQHLASPFKKPMSTII
jgi:hypothetical protein